MPEAGEVASPDAPLPAVPIATAALLAGVSGASTGVCLATWSRLARDAFGWTGSVAASTAAVGLAGVAIGAVAVGSVGGGRLLRREDPWRVLGVLALLGALGAAASGPLLGASAAIWVAAGGSVGLGSGAATLLRVVLTGVAIGPATVALGASVPVAARVVGVDRFRGAGPLGILGGTFALAAAAMLLPGATGLVAMHGARGGLLGASIAWVIGIGVLLGTVRERRRAPEEGEDGDGRDEAGGPAAGVLVVGGAVGLVAATVLGAWLRLAAPLLGTGAAASALVVAVSGASLAVGALAAAVAIGAPRRAAARLAGWLVGAAAALGPALVIGDGLADLAFHAHAMARTGFGLAPVGHALVAALLVAPASAVAGAFAVELVAATDGAGARGRAISIGRLVAAVAAGAALGAVALDAGLLAELGAGGVVRVAAVALVVLGVVVARSAPPSRAGLAVLAVVAVVAAAGILAPGPTAIWRHAAAGAGGERARVNARGENARRRVVHDLNRSIVHAVEGDEASLAIVRRVGLSLRRDGRLDGDAAADAPTAVLSGLLGTLLHDEPRRALVIGLGSGQTAGWLAAVPSVETVLVHERDAGVRAWAERCAASNRGVLEHSKVTLVTGIDPAEALRSSTETWDLIVVRPGHPARSAAARLYADDAIAAARARLAPGGLLLLRVPAAGMDGRGVAFVAATLRRSFEAVSIWAFGAEELLFVAPVDAAGIDVATVRPRLASPPFREAFGRVGDVWDLESLLARHVAGPPLVDAMAGVVPVARVDSDDRPLLELAAARGESARRARRRDDLLRAAPRVRRGRDPVLVGGASLDEGRLARARLAAFPTLRAAESAAGGSSAAWLDAWEAGDDAAMRAAVAAGSPAPPAHDLGMRLGRAWAAARGRAEERGELASELEALADAGLATDVAWIRLELALTDGAGPAIATSAAAAFEAARRDPWVRHDFIARALARLGSNPLEPSIAGGVGRELARGPFADERRELERRDTLRAVAVDARDDELCAASLELEEPWVPWVEPILDVRRRCYASVRPDRVARARADYELFIEQERRRLDELLRRVAGP